MGKKSRKAKGAAPGSDNHGVESLAAGVGNLTVGAAASYARDGNLTSKGLAKQLPNLAKQLREGSVDADTCEEVVIS